MREALSKPDQQTVAFFDRLVNDVVCDLSERIFVIDTPRSQLPLGTPNPKVLVVSTEQGEKRYKITLAEPYREEDATSVWSGKRLEQIRIMQPGEIVAYRGRRAALSFIKTRGGENIQIHELEDVEAGRKTRNATEVTAILGLGHAQMGRLTSLDKNSFRFERISR